MKTFNVLSTIVLGVALLASGCHRKPSLTPIPGMDPVGRAPGDTSGNQNPGIPLPNVDNPVTKDTAGNINETEGGPYASIFANGTEDRDELKNDTVHFALDSAVIKSEEESKLQDVASHLKGSMKDALQVEGNCDERGTEKYNLSLGERRALAIREYLVNLGLNPQQIKTVTYGASKPVAQGHSEEAYRQNRRGDMVVFHAK